MTYRDAQEAVGNGKQAPQPWRPPSIREPSAWQMKVVGEMLAESKDAVGQALSEIIGREIETKDVAVKREPLAGDFVDLGSNGRISRPLAAAIVSWMMGFDELARVDPAAPPEQALLQSVAEAFEQWIGAEKGDENVWVEARICADRVNGTVAMPADWQELWMRAEEHLKRYRRPPNLPLERITVEATVTIKGPEIEVGRLMQLRPGDFVALPPGSQSAAEIAVAGRRIAIGRLGAVRGRKAVRVERVFS